MQKMKMTKMLLNGQMVLQTVYLHSMDYYAIKKEKTIDRHKNLDGYHGNYAE